MVLDPESRSTVVSGEPFDRLFTREYPRVVAVARRVLLDADAAEDVAQDVFVAFARRHDPSSRFAAAWLHRAAVHRALNAIRGAQRRREREARDARLATANRLADSLDADPAQRLLRNEERRRVRHALARLPNRSRIVLALRHGGLTYAETAQALGVKVNVVGTLLARAEAALVKEISRDASR
jgi:RNA polymerase sigma factor (sigma-70 family)